MFCLMTHSHFYLWFYGVKHLANDHRDSERGNLLPPHHGILFSYSSKEYFICYHPTTMAVLNQLWSTGWNKK